jgi:hypothetical protein
MIPVLAVHDDGSGQLRVSLLPGPLCSQCFHAEAQASAAAQRRALQTRDTWTADRIREVEDFLSVATAQASPEEWRLLAAALRDMEALLGSPLPPEIRRFLRHEAGGDNEASA